MADYQTRRPLATQKTINEKHANMNTYLHSQTYQYSSLPGTGSLSMRYITSNLCTYLYTLLTAVLLFRPTVLLYLWFDYK